MYRPSVQAVPGAKALRHRPGAPMARRAVRNVVNRRRSSSRPSAVSGRVVRRRRPSSRRTTGASGPRAVPTTRHDG
ncbi:hypothetical protein B0293_18160 [Amycolatopsis azurea DSM 43854]|uniref:Uncharacterized protein n=1 Tax=Amycolatopsis azurea DSM 43854 TaxID=1238180 RepID=A0ABX3JG07_9PSEU|nr:hypothetical protein B0293_18160 [Amycolatopsis azurea DSM 43854]